MTVEKNRNAVITADKHLSITTLIAFQQAERIADRLSMVSNGMKQIDEVSFATVYRPSQRLAFSSRHCIPGFGINRCLTVN